MKQILTTSCKLIVTPEQMAKLDALLNAFADACQYVNETAPANLLNRDAMQALTYHEVRARFGLSSQLAIHAIRRVAANRKTAKHQNQLVQEFAPTSATYDSRIFSFREGDWSISIALLAGRERIHLHVGSYQKEKLSGQKPKTATLTKHRDGFYSIDIQLESTPPISALVQDALGVDLGRVDIAVTSEGETWSGKPITRIRDKYARVRAQLQKKASKGTRSCRRRCRGLLKRLWGREKRFQKHFNHVISKRIVLRAVELKATIAMEDLSGIRERTNRKPRSRIERRRSNSWAFFQLRVFVHYKAIKFGARLQLHNLPGAAKLIIFVFALDKGKGSHSIALVAVCLKMRMKMRQRYYE